ncbi:MAG: 4Fe-4S dicluster domain-containing protein [Anaerolineales bacterium]|nr:MAG: 4Fe-4S dicluster domain-containing protein [Anaerolineales bacterium]
MEAHAERRRCLFISLRITEQIVNIDLVVDAALVALGLVGTLGFVAFGWLSLREGVRRAATIAASTGTTLAVLTFFSLKLPFPIKQNLVIMLVGAALLLAVLSFISIKPDSYLRSQRLGRFDERDVVFSRARLQPGSQEYEQYYAMRPENLAIDEKFRALPGLLSLTARKAEPITFAAAEASFDLTQAVREAVDGVVASEKTPAGAEELTNMIKGLAQHLGAHNVGVTELKPAHVYSHIGRGTGLYGDPIVLDHHYAIAFSVEMDYVMMGRAPEAPVVMESARKYVDAAMIAIQLANLCRRLGYPARAHIDGNYRVIAPLVARDAGLGEIGRMGILMTPRLGPRVRLGIVTTDLPLLLDEPLSDSTMIHFCEICEKCAVNCPSKAIPFGDQEGDKGQQRWKLNENKCFHYWNVIGTDCGLCMTVCPFSHPDQWAHNLVREVIRRSYLSHRAALWFDDQFYGRKPVLRPLPAWLPPSSH